MKSKIILFMPHVGIGGVEKNFFLVSNFLAKNRKDIVVITISKNSKKFLNKNINFVTFNFDFWQKLGKRLKYLLALVLLLKEVFRYKSPLVISFQANIYCGLLSKLFGFDLIIRSNTSPEGWSKNILKRIIYKIGLKSAKAVLVNSIEFKKLMKKNFNLNAECIYNPVDKKKIIGLSKKKINFNFFEKNCLNIINVARLEKQKDQMTLLKAVNLIKNKIRFKLLIIGYGSMENELKLYIKKNNLENNIKILKNISNPFPYLMKSNLFILSSKFEGLPNVLLEALTLNKFIISTNCSTGPSEILLKGKGGILVPVSDHKNLAKQIIYYYKNKKKIKKKLLVARKNLFRFDMNNYFKHFLRIINKNINLNQ